MPLDIDKIIAAHKNRGEDNPDFFIKFYTLIDKAFELWGLKVVSASRTSYLIATNNFLVNVVTALELFFKETISANSFWVEDGYFKLLKDRISLSEAYDLFTKENISREYIIANYHSLQNFGNINYVMSALIGKDFYNEIETFIVYGDMGEVEPGTVFPEDFQNLLCLPMTYPEWKTTISDVYVKRNKFVHDGIIFDLNFDQITHIKDVTILYTHVVSIYISEFGQRVNKLP